MNLRFAPARCAVVSVVLAASLSLAPFAAGSDQSKKTAQTETPYPGKPVEEIIARVNDQVVNTSDYNRALQDLEQQAQQHQWTEQQLMDQKHNLLRDLIDQQLLLSRGKQLNITGETELVKQLDAMRKQYHLDSMEDLQKAAEAQGVSWEDFKATMRNHIISQMVIRDEVGSKINITPSEMKAYYDAHKDEFNQPEQERLSEILIPTADPDNAAQVAEAKKKADDAEAKLKGGEDFATLAKAVSGGVTAGSGGDLGEWRRGQLAKVFEDDTFGLKVGQFTEPIRTKQGWVILKVMEHTPGGIQPLKEVEPEVENAIGMEKMQPALRAYLTKLREAASIDIMGGYEDSGASPNEMKPVYSAYKPPTKKKKNHVARKRFNGRGRKANERPAAEVASSKPEKGQTMKPGKKEKIRFGQAPRETLPPAPTKEVNAAEGTEGTQIASNANTDAAADAGAPEEQQTEPQKKLRFADYKTPKEKKGPKIDPFAPPPPTTQETATREMQDQPLGLNGDTSKLKKKSPRKEGPKRRFSNEKKHEAQPASNSGTAPGTATNSGSDQQ
ncbi:MAG: peptidyl-prolyl cis-trans isomerase [Acidobacteriaceae bacterium]